MSTSAVVLLVLVLVLAVVGGAVLAIRTISDPEGSVLARLNRVVDRSEPDRAAGAAVGLPSTVDQGGRPS